MRAAVVENGVVINVVEVDDLSVIENLVQSDTANIGDYYDGLVFKPKES